MKQLYRILSSDTGIFLNRINKYVAEVDIRGKIELVHVHDPGRLTELLYTGNQVLVNYVESITRKTNWDLIAAKQNNDFILVNSMFHNKIAESILNDQEISPIKDLIYIKSEVKYKDSRFDFKCENKFGETVWVEIKGCTLSDNETAMFPDAPTVRGQRHLKELIEIKKSGEKACVIILVFSNAVKFRPKYETDPDFAKVFYEALECGVEIYPILLNYFNGNIVFEKYLDIMPNL